MPVDQEDLRGGSDSNPAERCRGQPCNQVVDPAVSRAKFQAQVEAFKRNEPDYRRQGWFLLSAEFPEVFLVLTVPHLRPAPVVFGVLINFVNYDVDPPSVRLVNPWTRELLRYNELITQLPRFTQKAVPAAIAAEGEPVEAAPPTEPDGPDAPGPQDAGGPPPPPAAANQMEFGFLMQSWTPDGIPFLCVRGVREYHRNPAHTGDAWLLHRGRGEGTLDSILSAIHHHGCFSVREYLYEFGIEQQVQPNSFAQRLTAQIRGLVYVIPGGTDLLVPLRFPS